MEHILISQAYIDHNFKEYVVDGGWDGPQSFLQMADTFQELTFSDSNCAIRWHLSLPLKNSENPPWQLMILGVGEGQGWPLK